MGDVLTSLPFTKKLIKMPLLPLYITLLCMGLYSSENHAEEKETLPDWDAETLSGAWHGQRAELYRQGIDIGLTHKSDGLADVSGGVKRGAAWLGHTEARINVDLEKVLGWSGTNAFVLYQSDLGSKFNSYYVGAVVGVDNVEVAHNTGLFFDAWIQRKWLNDHLSLLAGLYHVDSEFNVINASSLFLQPAYGMSNEIALTGTNGPPIFPLGALAIRFKAYSPGMDFYIQAAITDGVPGDPGNPKGTQITLAKGDGTFSIAEIGYTPQTPDSNEAEFFNKTAIGFWCYSSKFEGIGTDNSRHHSRGAYFLKEKTLHRESAHPSQGLAGFVRFGVASDQVNLLDWSGSMGLRYRGLVSHRDNDIAGIAVTINHASSAYQKSDQLQSAETDIEITYSAQVKPWLSIQPTVQKIIHPGLMPQVSNAWIIGTRVQIEL